MKRFILFSLLLFSISKAFPQSMMTVEQVYDYDPGDIFIGKEGGFYFPPIYTTTNITAKSYSVLLDTIFYTADKFQYTPQGCPNCVPVYDTILNYQFYVTQLTDTVGANLGTELQYIAPGCVDTAGYTGIWLDSIYFDTSFCAKLITKTWRMDNGPYLIDTCYDYFEPFYGWDEYGEGIGLKEHYYNFCADGSFYCQELYQLLFYKKGIDSCGLRPFIPLPSAINETDAENSISIFPNPFSTQTQLNFPVEQINSVITITDTMGKKIKSFSFSGRTLTLHRDNLSSGIYYVSVLNDKGTFSKKIIIQLEE